MSALFRTAPRIDSETVGHGAKRTLHDVGGRPSPFNNKHICVDEFSCRTNVNDRRKRGKINNNKLILSFAIRRRPASIRRWRERRADQEARVCGIAGRNAIWVDGSFQTTLLKRCPPISEFNNSTSRVRGDRARQRWISEIAINKDDGSAIVCDQLCDRQRDSRFSFVWSRGGDPNDPGRPGPVLQVDRQFDRSYALRESRKRMIDDCPTDSTVSSHEGSRWQRRSAAFFARHLIRLPVRTFGRRPIHAMRNRD